jgi:hypothetical protein
VHSMKRAVGAALTALTLSVGGVVGFASPAVATPNDCRPTIVYGYAGFYSVVCYGGSGQYAANATCMNSPNATRGHFVRGPYVGVGSNIISRAACPRDFPYLRSGRTTTIG